ncbi:MAG: Low specificity L-threonine aldolase [Firmicutes bacterium ADurb.Bin182]|nr:MAG: Low specificity L-threonine aldolase [Firmicutes bacterium ADurb.Bin182]
MYSFRNDYSEGAHPDILAELVRTNLEQTVGYGCDEYCERAKDAIRREINNENAAVYFISGGTQTNLIAISSFLRPHEAVIATSSGHINVHETGAIEATGHKVLTAQVENGKLTPELIKPILDFHCDEHMVKPRLVYISNSSEVGTVYNRGELSALSRFCKENGLMLYMDGARIGSALCSKQNDLTMEEIAKLTDAFYIGGTKNGLMMGEALVLVNDCLKADFLFFVKQRGALLAKGRLLGLQFLTLFTDGLFYKIASHENRMAELLKAGLTELGVPFLTDSPTNQQFPIFADDIAEKIKLSYDYEIQKKLPDGRTCIRLVTSWATPEWAVNEFLRDVGEMLRISGE